MIDHSGELTADHPDPDTSLWNFNSHQSLDSHGIGHIIDQSGAIIETVRINDEIMEGTILTQLFLGSMGVTKLTIRFLNRLTVQLCHHSQRTMHGWMSRANIDDHTRVSPKIIR